MSRDEFIGKLNALYVGNKNCLEELLTIYDKLVEENKELKDELKEYEQIGIMHFNRPLAKRYLEECRKEQPNLLYPDSEKIYEDYYKEQEKNKRAIAFLKEQTSYDDEEKNCYWDLDIPNCKKLLSILQGSDK